MKPVVPDRVAMSSRLQSGVAKLGVAVTPDGHERLLDFVELLTRWNGAYNLTAVRDPLEMVTRHVLDSLSVAPYVSGSTLADIGSGAGLPGIPLAILAPEREVLLIDSNGKKARFLREAIRCLGLGRVHVAEQRVEQVGGEFACVTARAFAALGEMLRLCGHLLAPHGSLLALKGQLSADEVAALPSGFNVADAQPLHVPGLGAARHVVIIKRSLALPHEHAA
jgi:16S rRNA (guanine527-N7)-methyltransferase